MNKKFIFVLVLIYFLFLQQEGVLAKFDDNRFDIINKKEDFYYNFNNNSVMFYKSNVDAPILENDLEENISRLYYIAYLSDYRNDSYNYLVFYKKDFNNNVKEIFRERILKSGRGYIDGKYLKNIIENNNIIFTRVESFSINNGKIENFNFSRNSKYYYTPKEYNLNIIENDNVIYQEKSIYRGEVDNKGFQKIPFSNFTKYNIDKYYTYNGAKLKSGSDYFDIVNGYVYIPYKNTSISLFLEKYLPNWKIVNIIYPKGYDNNNNNNNNVYIKSGNNFKDFLEENYSLFSNSYNKMNDNFRKFNNYTIDGIDINDYNKVVSSDVDIKAIFETKIIVNYGNNIDNIYLKTGELLSSIDLSRYHKKNYYIENFSVENNRTGEKTVVEDLSKIIVDDSFTITLNYKEQSILLKIRQDDYNSRFGLVEDSIKDKDIFVSKNKKIGEILSELKKKILPNEGYEVKFRVNKKELDENDYFSEDVILEVYFKKITDSWVYIKFIGEGVDKFLSDGQEVLVGSNIDSINLPTTTITGRKFLGWQSNHDYKIETPNGVVLKSKEELLQLSDIQKIITEKDKNLIFTARYFEPYYIEIENDNNGIVSIGTNNKIYIENSGILKNSLNNTIYIRPRSHYMFSHFTSTLPVTILKDDGGLKVIPTGEKISLSDFYKILPNENLTFYTHFTFYNNVLDYKTFGYTDKFNMIIDFGEKQKYNSNKNINSDILGPFIFLK